MSNLRWPLLAIAIGLVAAPAAWPCTPEILFLNLDDTETLHEPVKSSPRGGFWFLLGQDPIEIESKETEEARVIEPETVSFRYSLYRVPEDLSEGAWDVTGESSLGLTALGEEPASELSLELSHRFGEISYREDVCSSVYTAYEAETHEVLVRLTGPAASASADELHVDVWALDENDEPLMDQQRSMELVHFSEIERDPADSDALLLTSRDASLRSVIVRVTDIASGTSAEEAIDLPALSEPEPVGQGPGAGAFGCSETNTSAPWTGAALALALLLRRLGRRHRGVLPANKNPRRESSSTQVIPGGIVDAPVD